MTRAPIGVRGWRRFVDEEWFYRLTSQAMTSSIKTALSLPQ
jgi:hypothetical protein